MINAGNGGGRIMCHSGAKRVNNRVYCLWRHRNSRKRRQGTPTTTTGTVTTITQNGRPDKSPPAFRPSRTRSSKSFIHPRGKVHSRGHVCRADRHCKRGIYALSATQLLSKLSFLRISFRLYKLDPRGQKHWNKKKLLQSVTQGNLMGRDD